MIYFLSDKGRKEMPSEWIPFYHILEHGAKTLDGILESLKEYTDIFAVSKEIERGFGNSDDVERWLKGLIKKGFVNEVRRVQ